MPAFCEYVWRDNVTHDFHSKFRIVDREGNKDIVNAWTYDGTLYGESDEELILNPTLVSKSPFGKHYMALCVVSDKNNKNYGNYHDSFNVFKQSKLDKTDPNFSISQRYEMNYALDKNFGKEKNLALLHFECCLNANFGIQCFSHVEKNIWEFKTRSLPYLDAAKHIEICKYTLESLAKDNNVEINWDHKCEYTFDTKKTRGEEGLQHIKDTADKLGLSYNIGSKQSSLYIDNDTELKGKGRYTYTVYKSSDDPYDVCMKIYSEYLSVLPEEPEEPEEKPDPVPKEPEEPEEPVPQPKFAEAAGPDTEAIQTDS